MPYARKSFSGKPASAGQGAEPPLGQITPPSGPARIKPYLPTHALQRGLGASHLLQPGGPSHNPARDTRHRLEHQADARIAPQQAS